MYQDVLTKREIVVVWIQSYIVPLPWLRYGVLGELWRGILPCLLNADTVSRLHDLLIRLSHMTFSLVKSIHMNFSPSDRLTIVRLPVLLVIVPGYLSLYL